MAKGRDNFQTVYFVGVNNDGHMFAGEGGAYAEAIRNLDDYRDMTVVTPSRGLFHDVEGWDLLIVADQGHDGRVMLGGRDHGFQTPKAFVTDDLVVIDAVAAGSGRDVLRGDRGPDCFVFAAPCGKDVIKNFDRKKDAILLDTDLARTDSEVRKVAEAYDGGVALRFTEDDVVKIKGVDLDDLRKIDFLFHDI